MTSNWCSTLGFSCETNILLLVFLGGLIFYAKDLRLGIIAHVILFLITFISLALLGMVYWQALTAFLLSIVAMVLSVLLSTKKPEVLI
jgi:hypothetical protein